ncbi:surfeit locus protein 1 isoform X2 [Zootermopsis nevadensis]|uniref:surfeit locus protein 1 isoform X2 n=1 Tax=Zootermopsis nevadensis TaxID=136037 RepID=UPI000B8E7329|nr:surfeit locus protein 1 isoform X2 [Zootermopsis nevadensis]
MPFFRLSIRRPQQEQTNRAGQCMLQNMRYVSATHNISHKNSTFSSMKWFLLLVPTTTFGLGTWQVYRRKWKRQLIADLKARTSAAPYNHPLDVEELSRMEYHPVCVRGHFDHSRELYIGPRTLLVDGDAGITTHKRGVQSGYHVVTPFHLSDQDMTILVNRGWVPANQKNPNTRRAGQVEGEVEIVGIVRLGEKRAPFTPENQPHTWFYRDVPRMAKMAGTEAVFLDAKAETTVPDGPIGGQTRVTLRDEHLSYSLTWYGLSAATGFMWYRLFIARRPLL